MLQCAMITTIMESSQVTIWPPLYTVKKSTRAKQVRLSIHPQKGLTIHLPQHTRRPVDIDALLMEKKAWILRHSALLEQASKKDPMSLPTSLLLSAIDETWQVDHMQNCAKPTLFAAAGSRLVIMDKDLNIERAIRLLHLWLKKKAQQQLIPWLTELSLRHQLPFNNAAVRNQKTQWGSCSTSKNIQLNYKILFLPKALAEHILLHELSHIQHLNHSRAFWRLLSTLDPHCHEHNKALKTIEAELPAWLY
jgi:predicted metal-dependent hydrolase